MERIAFARWLHLSPCLILAALAGCDGNRAAPTTSDAAPPRIVHTAAVAPQPKDDETASCPYMPGSIHHAAQLPSLIDVWPEYRLGAKPSGEPTDSEPVIPTTPNATDAFNAAVAPPAIQPATNVPRTNDIKRAPLDLPDEPTAPAPATASTSTPAASPTPAPPTPRGASAAASISEPVKLPWVSDLRRSRELDIVDGQALLAVQQGFDLANRGAVYSARRNMIQALEMLAEAYDAQSSSTHYSRALAAGLLALEEADDFAPRDGRADELNLARIVHGHQTPLLKEAGQNFDELSVVQAIQRYYTYAQEQLSLAGGIEPAGSLALYGLGKLCSGSAAAGASGALSSLPRAVVFQQAALLANSQNYLAANELGVLFARFGRWPDARRMLLHSLSIVPQSIAWRNLAAVHQALGETALAGRARQEAQLVARREPSAAATPYNLQWIGPDAFARDSLARAGNVDSAGAKSSGASKGIAETSLGAGSRR